MLCLNITKLTLGGPLVVMDPGSSHATLQDPHSALFHEAETGRVVSGRVAAAPLPELVRGAPPLGA